MVQDEQEVTGETAAAEETAGELAGVEAGVRALIQQLALTRRELKDHESERNEATRRFLLELLDVSDAFDRVFANARDQGEQLDPLAKRWINSFRTVDRLLGRALRNQGVVEIQTLDQMFDPYWHTAAEVLADPERPEGSIHHELRKGYVWKNQVLRKTEAVVVKNDGA